MARKFCKLLVVAKSEKVWSGGILLYGAVSCKGLKLLPQSQDAGGMLPLERWAFGEPQGFVCKNSINC